MSQALDAIRLHRFQGKMELCQKNSYFVAIFICSSTYIGETSKIVGDRVKEHRRNIVIGNA